MFVTRQGLRDERNFSTSLWASQKRHETQAWDLWFLHEYIIFWALTKRNNGIRRFKLVGYLPKKNDKEQVNAWSYVKREWKKRISRDYTVCTPYISGHQRGARGPVLTTT